MGMRMNSRMRYELYLYILFHFACNLMFQLMEPFPKQTHFSHGCRTSKKLLITRKFSFLYAPRRRDVLWDHPWRAGGWRPVLCPEHISKTTLARVMKFHGWIDLIQGECSAQES